MAEKRSLTEREFAYLREKKRIEYEWANGITRIPADLPESELRSQVRAALKSLTHMERRAMEQEIREAYRRIDSEFDSIDDSESIVDREGLVDD